ncbi:MAG: insulinase family protein [Lachnospiraceae bacterium]|nr:insulinase family protein [Lachnospiraceae bacterium]
MTTLLKPDSFKVAIGNIKTNIFGMAFINTVTRDNVIKSAILSEIFLNSSKLFKTPVEINRRLNTMRGAVYNAGVCRKGDALCLTVTIETLKSVTENEARSFLDDIVFKPLVCEKAFDSKVFNKAADTVRRRILSYKDDKKTYAAQRCLEEMFDFSGYGVPDYGYIEDIDNVNEETLYRYYEGLISAKNIDKGIVGEKVNEKSPVCRKLKEVTENTGAVQGRLCMGFSAEGCDEISLSVLNEIIGGNAGSKLFNEVRERENLCYYVNSAMHRFKNIIIVQAGIEKDARDKTEELIEKAIEKLKDDITQDDVDKAKAAVKNIYLHKADDPYGKVDEMIDKALYGNDLIIDNRIKRLDGIGMGDVLEALDSLVLKTKYFLG